MQNQQMAWAANTHAVAHADVETRANFISRTYSHLLGAILAFACLEFMFFATGIADRLAPIIANYFLVFIGLFIVVGMLTSKMAMKVSSPTAQYAALFGYVLIESIIFLPLLWVANGYFPGVITSAAVLTLVGFSVLTGIAFATRKDFSFMGGMIRWVGFLLIAMIIMSLFMPGSLLTTGIAVLAIGLAGASILYETSNIIHHYPANMHVAAALGLFASVAMMFYYVIILFMQMQSD